MNARSTFSRLSLIALCASTGFVAACGGANGTVTSNPVSVSLPVSTVTVTRNGAPVTIPIQIQSTSETALVMVSGLPAGVGESYAASDTNPSGTLTFSATGFAAVGTFMPTVKVTSAGQFAAADFTLIVKIS
jgi:hypothetical protein